MKNIFLNLVGLPTIASSMSVFDRTIKNLDKVNARHRKAITANDRAIEALHADNAARDDEAFGADVLARKLRNLMS